MACCICCVSLVFMGFSKSCRPYPSLQSLLPLVAWTWISSGCWRKPGVTQRARSLLQRSQTCSCPHPGTLSSEHSALMWLSWFFPQSEGSPRRETVLSILAKCYHLIGRKKWQNVFPGYFYAFQFSKHLLLAKCKAVWGNQSYITPPLSSLGCQVLGTKLACKIPPCALRDTTVYLIWSHRDLWGF